MKVISLSLRPIRTPSCSPAHSRLRLRCVLSSASSSRAKMSAPERRNGLPVYVLYGSWNFWNYGLPAWKKKKKKSPFRPGAGSCSVPLASLAVRFGQRADYPVVMATANRKCPAAGKAWGFVPVFAGSFLASVRTLCPKLGQKIQREPGPPFTLAPLYGLLALYSTKSL